MSTGPSFYSTKSKADATRKAEKYKAKYELEQLCGGTPERPLVLFQDWAIQCLELYKKPYVKSNTYNGTYLAPTKLHQIPVFGSMPLDTILPIHIQRYINNAAKKYAPKTVKRAYPQAEYDTVYAFAKTHPTVWQLCC